MKVRRTFITLITIPRLLGPLLCFFLAACDTGQQEATPSAHMEPSAQVINGNAPEASAPKVDSKAKLGVIDISERNKEGKNGIAVTFSTPVDNAKNIQSYFSVSHKKDGHVAGAWVLSANKTVAWFLNVEPQQSYSVSVNPGLTAENKSVLMEPSHADLTTRKLMPSISFISNGAVLPINYSSGLPVSTVNIDKVDIDFFRIDDNQIAAFVVEAHNYGRQGWRANTLANFGSLVYSGRFELNPPKNTQTKVDINFRHVKVLNSAGLYLAVMRSAGDYDERQITWFSVTDIGLHVRDYANQLDVHAASLTTGKPLANIKITLLNNKNQTLQENKTTVEGLASFTGDLTKAKILIAQTKDQYSLLNLAKPALDLSDYDLGSRPQLPMEFFIYSPRNLYRPGETVNLSGLLRDYDGQLQQSPVLNGELISANGKVVKTFKWQSEKLGYYEYLWQIPSDAETGKWHVSVTGPLKHAVIYDFNVEEFLPERMKLTLASGQPRTTLKTNQENITLDALGEYLYGAPASGNRLSAFVTIEHWRSPVDNLKDFEFGHSLDQEFSRRFDLQDIQLDENGKGQLLVNNNWRESQSPLAIRINTSLYESGGRPITRSHKALVWPKQALIGIRPDFKKNNPAANSLAGFDIVYANLAGELLQANNVELALIKEDRQYFWEFSSYEGWHWSWTDKEFTVKNDTVSIENGQSVKVSFPVDWGNYRLEVREPNTNTLSSIRFFAGYNWYYDWENAKNQGAARPDKVNLALDKPKYQAGETAKLKILPPQAGKALILVESDRPLWSTKISVPKEGTTVDIPISSEWDTHNIYVSALIVEPTNDVKAITPKRSLGLIHLPLDRGNRELSILLDAPDKTKPETQLTTSVTIKQADGSVPKHAMVTLAAVDIGVLNITNFATPDPFNYFFGQRRYSVDAKDIYSDVIEANRFTAITPKFGGDADLARGGEQPKSDVQIVSLFSGPVDINQEGKAEIPLALPNFNGAVRLMAVAFNRDSYGKQSKEVTIAAPIVAEIAMPRFLAYQDESQIVLDVRNMTETPQTLTVELDLDEGLALLSNAKSDGDDEVGSDTDTGRDIGNDVSHHVVQLKPGEKTSLIYQVKATRHQGMAAISAKISGKGIDDFSRRWKLGLRPAYPALTKQQQKILKAGATYVIERGLFAGILPDTLAASVTLSPVVNLQIAEQIKNLLAYPYGCLEQTSSRAFPLTYATTENRERFGIDNITEATRFDMMQKGVDRIVKFQLSNGGFGLWDNRSPEEHWLTVYATDFLLSAKTAGLDVPEKPLQKAIKRLNYYLNNSGSLFRQRWSTNSAHYAFATRAYAGYVLSKINQAPLGSLRTLYSNNFKQAASGLSQLQLGLALINMGDNKNGMNALNKAVEHTTSQYDYWGDYGSEIRDLGMMVHLLVTHNKLGDQALALSLKLYDKVQNRRWLSTQERIALFLAGIALEEKFNQRWLAQWQVGEESHSIEGDQSWRKILNGAMLQHGFSLQSQHSNALYINTQLTGYGEKAPAPESKGMSIERDWYTVDGKFVTPSTVKSGELYLVHIRMNSEKRSPDALLVNLVPAGFELENQNLENGIKLNQFKIDGKSIAELQKHTKIKYQEYREDRYVAALELNGYRENHLFFLIRAVTPGTYQVPPPLLEDMYRPEIRAVGATLPEIKVIAL